MWCVFACMSHAGRLKMCYRRFQGITQTIFLHGWKAEQITERDKPSGCQAAQAMPWQLFPNEIHIPKPTFDRSQLLKHLKQLRTGVCAGNDCSLTITKLQTVRAQEPLVCQLDGNWDKEAFYHRNTDVMSTVALNSLWGQIPHPCPHHGWHPFPSPRWADNDYDKI